MSGPLLGYINFVKSGTVTANNAAANFPVTNLQNDSGHAADGWQTTIKTGILLTITSALGLQPYRLIGLFRSNMTSAAVLVFTVYTNPSTVVWTATVGGPVNGSGQVVVDTGGVIGDYATVLINDAGNPQPYVNVALAYAGPAWSPLSNFSLATSYGRDVTTDEMISHGGQEYPVYRYQRRRWDLDMQGVRTSSELWPILDAMMRIAAPGANILVVPDFGSADMTTEASFGRIKQTADVKYPLGTADRRSWSGQHTERV
ncbi:MAG TPA: hypothetical protein VL614_00490 [Acetobacteraceae bacterium]|jgi:hypothetical protein|nr:hypothetical protein [Acetobacteraceae bacterium]